MRLEIAWRWAGRRGEYVLDKLGGARAPLLGWKGERGLEEVEEAGLAGRSCADDEDAVVAVLARLTFSTNVFLVRGNLLEWRRVLPSTDAARAVNRAHSTAGIAVAATVRHALGASIGVHESVGGNRGDRDAARGR